MPRGWGFGAGFGWHARGPGRGRGRFAWHSPWCPGWGWAYYAVPWGGAYAPGYQDEVEFLAARAEELKAELEMIQKRLDELEQKKEQDKDKQGE